MVETNAPLRLVGEEQWDRNTTPERRQVIQKAMVDARNLMKYCRTNSIGGFNIESNMIDGTLKYTPPPHALRKVSTNGTKG
jgi:hypothetical protein